MRGIFCFGPAGAGKTTVANMLVEMIGNAKRYALADPIRQLEMEFFLPTGGKPRARYQKIGQSFREIDPDVWIRALDRTISGQRTLLPVLDDLRQPNEYKHYSTAGFVSIRIDAPTLERYERMRLRDGDVDIVALEHYTEHMLDDAQYDYHINNDGTLDQLHEAVKEVWHNIGQPTHSASQ